MNERCAPHRPMGHLPLHWPKDKMAKQLEAWGEAPFDALGPVSRR